MYSQKCDEHITYLKHKSILENSTPSHFILKVHVHVNITFNSLPETFFSQYHLKISDMSINHSKVYFTRTNVVVGYSRFLYRENNSVKHKLKHFNNPVKLYLFHIVLNGTKRLVSSVCCIYILNN